MKKNYFRSTTRYLFVILLTGLLFDAPSKASAQTLPANFQDQLVSSGWTEVEGFTFDANGRRYVWEKAGKVWIVDTNGIKLLTPLLDISEEVGGWRDHGLNGFALDPDFLSNGYFYLFYTVDRHYLMNYGTPAYNANTNEYYNATIVRVTRYTADAATNFTSVVNGSRLVLVGENKKTGIPLLHESHSGGSLVFGRDGSLLVSTGDGASYNFADGGGGATYWSQGLTDTIIRPKENIGAFRSQLVDCLAGKVLRIDPATGDGLPSNPFFDPANPRAPKSRVWALGLRNPFRMTIRPNTGSTDITAGDPGVLYVGDVGWGTWEDLQVIKGPGKNCGWPIYEGLTVMSSYNIQNIQNQDAPNPLFGTGGCTQQYFYFNQLLQQATLNPNPGFPNPCNNAVQIPAGIPKFLHERPAVDWRHGSNQARTGTWSGNNAAEINLNSPGSPVYGPVFPGNASVGGVWYTGNTYPVIYQNTYFHGDYGAQWIKNFKFDGNNDADTVKDFESSNGAVVFVGMSPKDKFIHYVRYPDQIRRIAYTLNVNNPPVAVATSDIHYGGSPLTVSFTGNQSSDPEGMPLTYLWKFGNGDSSILANPTYIYSIPGSLPASFYAILKVTDNTGQVASDSVFISVNNSPPSVQITSFNDGDLYTTAGLTNLPLQAQVSDLEHGPNELFYRWQTILKHNNHEHPEGVDTNKVTSTVISPVGCNGETFYFQISLTVTDAAGLSTQVSSNLYPACNPPEALFQAADTLICRGDAIQFSDLSTNLPTYYNWSFPGGNPSSSTLQNPVVQYAATGYYDVTLIVTSPMGTDTLTKSGYIQVKGKPLATLTPLGPTSICYGSSVTLQASTSGSFTYQWKRDGHYLAGASGSAYMASKPGTYKAVLTNASGCTNASPPVQVSVEPVAVITAGGPLTFCLGDSVLLTANSGTGYAYQWRLNNSGIPGATAQSYMAKSAGKYSVKVTTPNGCTRISGYSHVTINCKLGLPSGPVSFTLQPNPAGSEVVLNLALDSDTRGSIQVFDALGKNVLELSERIYEAGGLEVKFSVANLKAGVYYCRFQSEEITQTQKLIISR